MTRAEVLRLADIWHEQYERIHKLERSGVEERYIDRTECNAAWRAYKDALNMWGRYKAAKAGSKAMRDGTGNEHL